MSLNNLGNRLSELGRREEALAAADEAVRIRRQLAAARPDAFLPDLAMSLGARGNVLLGMERHADAAASFREGIEALRPLFQRVPAAFASLMRALCRDYVEASKAAGQQPDLELLQPVVAVLESLEDKAAEE